MYVVVFTITNIGINKIYFKVVIVLIENRSEYTIACIRNPQGQKYIEKKPVAILK